MDAGITISADEVFDAGERGFGVMDFDSVHVSGPGEAETNGDERAGARWLCQLCGERLNEDGQAIDDIRGYCVENDDEDEVTEDGDNGPHHPEPIPVSWLNSAGIDVDSDKDEVYVSISVGDPRGAFVMRVERMRYTDDDGNEVDELRLKVPTDQDGMPHMQLTPLASPGYYRIKS